ncbi:MAG: type II toxin-antitoxin system VapC family toxin [Holophagales bacterium]|nr:type II toxin-antitoxin system VapC family toxin [Holophagales bacterium]
MAYLVDTNVLLRLVAEADPRHLQALSAIDVIEERDEPLFTSSQNFIELWNVATRPVDRNGLGQTPQVAQRILSTLEASFPRLGDSDRIYEIWRGLVVRFGVSGVKVHDTRLVAVMLAHDIRRLLTFDTKDFERFSELGIEAVSPTSL